MSSAASSDHKLFMCRDLLGGACGVARGAASSQRGASPSCHRGAAALAGFEFLHQLARNAGGNGVRLELLEGKWGQTRIISETLTARCYPRRAWRRSASYFTLTPFMT